MNHRRPGRGPVIALAVLAIAITALGLYLVANAAVNR